MRRTFVSFCAAALLTALASAPAAAATLKIQFTGLDVEYSSQNAALTDSPNIGVGDLDPTEADPLVSMDFFLDNLLVGSLSSNIWADLAIHGIDPIPANGNVAVNAYGGQLDLLFGAGKGISLDFYDVQFFVFQGSASLTGMATAELFKQILVPFNVAFDPDEPIEVLLALGSLQNKTSSNGFLTGFNADGTGSIAGTGQLVPEPTSLFLLGSGLLAAAAARRRARAQR